jgi:hypothetical protein
MAALSACASTVYRLENESVESFAEKNGPAQAEIVHKVIETDKWNGKSKAIISCYEQEFEKGDQDYRRISCYIFVPENDNTYRKILIDVFEPEGGDPEIESVFLAEAGKSKETKLVIICSWEQIHYDFHGKLYDTFVYEAPQPDTKTEKLKFEKSISKKLYGGCDCQWRNGTTTTARFKIADEVKAALRKIGD